MSLFRHRARSACGPVATPLPAIGDVVTVRQEGATRLWLATVQAAAGEVLSLHLDSAHHDCRDTIPVGENVYIVGVTNPSVRLRAQSRSRNGSVLGLYDVTAITERPSRTLPRIRVSGEVWCEAPTMLRGGMVEVVDLSLGGLAMRAWAGAKAGDVVSLVMPSSPERRRVNGVVVQVDAPQHFIGMAHVAFLAGTTPEAVEALTDGLVERSAAVPAARVRPSRVRPGNAEVPGGRRAAWTTAADDRRVA